MACACVCARACLYLRVGACGRKLRPGCVCPFLRVCVCFVSECMCMCVCVCVCVCVGEGRGRCASVLQLTVSLRLHTVTRWLLYYEHLVLKDDLQTCQNRSVRSTGVGSVADMCQTLSRGQTHILPNANAFKYK